MCRKLAVFPSLFLEHLEILLKRKLFQLSSTFLPRYLVQGKTSDAVQLEEVSKFLKLIKYVSGAYDSAEGFQKLDKEISEHEVSRNSAEGTSRRLFYFALPPSVYPSVCKMIKHYCMNKSDLGGWTRIVVEKPFGKDLASAEKLSSQIGELFDEPQIYRIDHYLGKELVQNLLVLSFRKPLFSCPFGTVTTLIMYRSCSGRILVPRGVVDILMNMGSCLVAMEKPISLKPEHIRDEKVKFLKSAVEFGSPLSTLSCRHGLFFGQVLQSVLPIKDEEVVLGQYEGYRDDPTVPDHSNTPTFATMVLRIHNERWEGKRILFEAKLHSFQASLFIMKAGKALSSRKAEIRVQFKDVPGDIFRCKKQGRNEFVIRLQPSEAMYMKLTVKKPGLEMSTVQSELDLSYRQRYQGVTIPEAYERLILDTIRGDQQHFVRRDELKAAWEIFTPLLHRIDNGEVKSLPYKPGSRGPAKADELLEKAVSISTVSTAFFSVDSRDYGTYNT
ncbi:Glucose-6-phosphate 1-dehydrogenase, cytoplasmic isoform, partial [Cucurbita argyrosperma subsp. sororia]